MTTPTRSRTRGPDLRGLRANALERLGHLEHAVTALRQRMGKEGYSGREMMKKIIASHPTMQLCPQSFSQALADHTEVAAKHASQGVGGMIGGIFYWAGLALVVGGTILAIGIGAVIAIPVMRAGGGLLEGLGSAAFTGGITWVSIIATGAPFMLVGWVFRKRVKEAAWLREHGVSCTGIVRGYSATGTRINGVPLVRVQVDVNHPQMNMYSASFDQLLSANLQAVLQPGTEVPLRIHPQQPTKILLEMS